MFYIFITSSELYQKNKEKEAKCKAGKGVNSSLKKALILQTADSNQWSQTKLNYHACDYW